MAQKTDTRRTKSYDFINMRYGKCQSAGRFRGCLVFRVFRCFSGFPGLRGGSVSRCVRLFRGRSGGRVGLLYGSSVGLSSPLVSQCVVNCYKERQRKVDLGTAKKSLALKDIEL